MGRERRSTAAAGLASLALLLAAPRPHTAVVTLLGAAGSTDPTAPVVAAAALLAWLVACWLALTTGVVLLSRVPGLLGRTARALAGRVAPATVRCAVEAALGLTVAVGAVAPTAALAAPPAPPVLAAAQEAWDLDWPSRAQDPPLPRTVSPTPRPPSVAPTTVEVTPVVPPAHVVPSAPSVQRPSVQRPSVQRPSLVAPRPAGRPPATPAAVVVVRAGDTLWALAEAALRREGTAAPTDRQVALAWPRWWAANREAVGDDPDLLLPGTVLRPPPDGA